MFPNWLEIPGNSALQLQYEDTQISLKKRQLGWEEAGVVFYEMFLNDWSYPRSSPQWVLDCLFSFALL